MLYLVDCMYTVYEEEQIFSALHTTVETIPGIYSIMIKSIMEYCYSTKNNITITINGIEKASKRDCKIYSTAWIMTVLL